MKITTLIKLLIIIMITFNINNCRTINTITNTITNSLKKAQAKIILQKIQHIFKNIEKNKHNTILKSIDKIQKNSIQIDVNHKNYHIEIQDLVNIYLKKIRSIKTNINEILKGKKLYNISLENTNKLHKFSKKINIFLTEIKNTISDMLKNKLNYSKGDNKEEYESNYKNAKDLIKKTTNLITNDIIQLTIKMKNKSK